MNLLPTCTQLGKLELLEVYDHVLLGEITTRCCYRVMPS